MFIFKCFYLLWVMCQMTMSWKLVTVTLGERHDVMNHRHFYCLFNSLFRLTAAASTSAAATTTGHRISNHFEGKTPVTGGLHTQRASVEETISMSSYHYSDVIMSAMVSQITSLTIVYSIVYTCADQRKHQISASLAFVRIHRWPVTGEFPAQMASNAENVSIWWRHHVVFNFTVGVPVVSRMWSRCHSGTARCPVRVTDGMPKFGLPFPLIPTAAVSKVSYYATKHRSKAVYFIRNSHNKYHMTRHWGRGIWCLAWGKKSVRFEFCCVLLRLSNIWFCLFHDDVAGTGIIVPAKHTWDPFTNMDQL